MDRTRVGEYAAKIISIQDQMTGSTDNSIMITIRICRTTTIDRQIYTQKSRLKRSKIILV